MSVEKRPSNYQRIVEQVEALKCPACKGSGTEDDAEPGDIYFNEWTCSSCYGSGWKDATEKRELRTL